MLTTTKAIVLSTIKYSDHDLIVKCYTLENGVQSFLIKGIFKHKKGKLTPALFFPLNQIELTASYRDGRTLHFIKEVKINYPYSTLYTDVVKQTIVFFLSEVLSSGLKEEEKNQSLYTYIETALQWLDSHSKVANFHLIFMVLLMKHLGFYPNLKENAIYFDLEEGKFTDLRQSNHYLTGENLKYFKQLLGTNFDTVTILKYTKEIRQTLLEIVIQYFELHLPGFKKPRSLEVLKTVFS